MGGITRSVLNSAACDGEGEGKGVGSRHNTPYTKGPTA